MSNIVKEEIVVFFRYTANEILGKYRTEMAESPLYIRLASDRPSNIDAFNTHEPIAETILNIIKTNDGGKTIGLEGDWGSGKSTVVRFLAEKIRGTDTSLPIEEYEIFVFDSWEHQGDPLRLSFLLTLLNYLAEGEKKKNWIDKARIRVLEEDLIKKQTETKAEVGIPAGAVGIILLLIAIFSATIGGFPEPLKASFWAWVFFPFALLILLIIVVVHYKDALGSFVNSPPPMVTTATDDKTSVEFKKFFKKLMQEALPKDETKLNRRFIVVVDNLDRISKDDALAIWSTLRTYLEYSEHFSGDEDWSWRERLWTIIPYSYEGIKTLWEDSKEHIEIQKGKLVKSSRENTPHGDSTLAHNFLDKTFDLKICVPPIISTKWKEYLRKLLEEAFSSKIDGDTLYNVETIYEIFADGYLHTYPTPRHIKLFVNEIVTQYMSWNFEEEKISLAQVAYFILSKRYEGGISELIKKLRNCDGDSPPTIDKRIPALLKMTIKEFCVDIAALTFNSKRETAMELLIGRDISLAFNRHSATTLESSLTLLEGVKHNPAFWLVADKNLTKVLRDGQDKAGLLYAARCIRESGILDIPLKSVADEKYIKSLLHTLEEKLIQLNHDDFCEGHVQGLVDLIVITGMSEDAKRYLLSEILTYKVSTSEETHNG